MNHRAEKIAELFHTYYEDLAPRIGYATRKASAVPWKDVPKRNKELMIATVEAVLNHLAREADFEDGAEVECVIPIPDLAKKGERGEVHQPRGGGQMTIVLRGGEGEWYVHDLSEAALHFKRVSHERERRYCAICREPEGSPHEPGCSRSLATGSSPTVTAEDVGPPAWQRSE